MMHGAGSDPASQEVAIICTLSAQEQAARREEIAHTILAGRQEMVELPDGYALRFPGDAAWAEKLLAFIVGERECCAFFTFELIFAPQQGPLWLHLRGPEGTKEIVVTMLGRQD
jgi:hypothetical protein